MAAVVLVDASDMKEYVVHLDEENAKRAATDVTYALSLLNTEKARFATPIDENATATLNSAKELAPAAASDNAEDSSFRWTHAETELLLKEYVRLKPLFNSGRVSRKKCWHIIATTLNKDGITVSAAQCVSKFNGLKRTYRAVQNHLRDTGQLKSWLFFKEMDDLLGKESCESGAQETNNDGDSDKWRADSESFLHLAELLDTGGTATEDGTESFRWLHEAIMLLIAEAMKVRQLCESGVLTQKRCWDRVAEALKRQGYDVTGRQCMTKFNCLRRTYKSINEHNARLERGEGSARRRMDWIYFDIVGKLLEDSWTCTLNTSSDSPEENAMDSDDVEMVLDSREINAINKTNNSLPVETDSHPNETGNVVIGLTMENDEDSRDLDQKRTEDSADNSSTRENGTATNKDHQRRDKSTSELRNILAKKEPPVGNTVKNPDLQRKFAVPRRGSLVPKSRLRNLTSDNKLKLQSKSNTLPSVDVIREGSGLSGRAKHHKNNGRSSKLKEDALRMLHDLKDEIARQNREIQKQGERKEAFCEKIIAQNEIMIRQRERRNELLEELVRLRKNDVQP